MSPEEVALQPGATTDLAFQFLTVVASSFVAPLITDLLKLLADGKFRRLSVSINGLLCCGLYYLGWRLFSGEKEHLVAYLLAGAVAAVAAPAYLAARDRMAEAQELRKLKPAEVAKELRIAEVVDSGEVVGELVERKSPPAEE